jgi:hypothetical protein
MQFYLNIGRLLTFHMHIECHIQQYILTMCHDHRLILHLKFHFCYNILYCLVKIFLSSYPLDMQQLLVFQSHLYLSW